MPRYHITPSKRVTECTAPSDEACPFNRENPHFATEKEAEEYRDNMKIDSSAPLFVFEDADKREARIIALEEIEAIRQETEEKIEALRIETEEKIESIASTVGRWHITPSQRVKPCLSEPGNCPFGNESLHFSTKQEAEEYRDNNKPNQNGTLFVMPSDEE